jgi:hypothetical protein
MELVKARVLSAKQLKRKAAAQLAAQLAGTINESVPLAFRLKNLLLI